MNQWRLRGRVINVGEAKFRRSGQTRARLGNMDSGSKQGRGPEDSRRGKEVAPAPLVEQQPGSKQLETYSGNGGTKRIEVAIVEANMSWLRRSLVGLTLKPLDPKSLKNMVCTNMPHIVDIREIGACKVLLTFDTVQHADEAFTFRLNTLLHVFHRVWRWEEADRCDTRRV
ncbi:uncharacterized protein DS421_20g702010 [Arachis hypogaea]|nr:uncharacterized protein DS421_20g702010 [Arachis hypogaea]